MRKVVLIGLLVFFLSSSTVVFAEEFATPSAVLSPTPQTIDYSLPYPGILPGNPLYLLKVTRDRVIGFLIVDPAKKAEFDLLQADKRLEMGVFLLQNHPKDNSLVFSTIAKGQNYFEEAIGKMGEAKKQGHVLNDLGNKLLLASEKHQEVLKNLADQAQNGVDKKQFLNLSDRMHAFEMQLKKLLNKSTNSNS